MYCWRVLVPVAVVAAVVFAPSPSSQSAIPMWEFLSRGEKMSKLFNMFVKQVSEHCDTSTMPDCQKVLLVYGLTNLAKMEDDSLDKMDPYQRGANDIIWESMMGGNYKKKNHENTDLYNSHSIEGGNTLGSEEGAGSDRVESYEGTRYVVGPMVVRVMPDGSPVEPADPLPKDEDAQEYLPAPSLPQRITQEVMQSHSTLQHIQQHAQQRLQQQHQMNQFSPSQQLSHIVPPPLGFVPHNPTIHQRHR